MKKTIYTLQFISFKCFYSKRRILFFNAFRYVGKYFFVSGLIDIKQDDVRVIDPAMFLVDEESNILYKFNAPFLTGTKIISVTISDLNIDSLKDIDVTFGFFDYETDTIISDMETVEWLFLQMENGLFYDSVLRQDK